MGMTLVKLRGQWKLEKGHQGDCGSVYPEENINVKTNHVTAVEMDQSSEFVAFHHSKRQTHHNIQNLCHVMNRFLTIAAVLQIGPDDVFLREAEHAKASSSHGRVDGHARVCNQLSSLVEPSSGQNNSEDIF